MEVKWGAAGELCRLGVCEALALGNGRGWLVREGMPLCGSEDCQCSRGLSESESKGA